jgi:hypothetical protein
MEDTIYPEVIESRIWTIRGQQVMLDRDLAEMYGVETRILNQAVKRNKERFLILFCFQLEKDEFLNWRSQIVISNQNKMGLRRFPFVFTEQGVAMLSAVLRSDTAVKVSIQIMSAFVKMRQIIQSNSSLIQRLDRIELKQLETDQKFDQIFKALESKKQEPEKGIFFDGQVFDAYIFVSDLIRKANKSIILIDNYVDDTVLTLFTKRKKSVTVDIFTKNIGKQFKLDVDKFNSQYPKVSIHEFTLAHDRFLILDEATLYHLGASLKDLGKKWFAFSIIDLEVTKILDILKTIRS